MTFNYRKSTSWAELLFLGRPFKIAVFLKNFDLILERSKIKEFILPIQHIDMLNHKFVVILINITFIANRDTLWLFHALF